MKYRVNIYWLYAAKLCREDQGELAVSQTFDDDKHFFRRVLLTEGVTPERPKVYIGYYGVQAFV